MKRLSHSHHRVCNGGDMTLVAPRFAAIVLTGAAGVRRILGELA